MTSAISLYRMLRALGYSRSDAFYRAALHLVRGESFPFGGGGVA